MVKSHIGPCLGQDPFGKIDRTPGDHHHPICDTNGFIEHYMQFYVPSSEWISCPPANTKVRDQGPFPPPDIIFLDTADPFQRNERESTSRRVTLSRRIISLLFCFYPSNPRKLGVIPEEISVYCKNDSGSSDPLNLVST